MVDYNQYIDDKVYLKRDIKKHRIFENHPNLIFGIIIFLWGALLFATMFLMNMFPFFVVLLSIIPICVWYIGNNEKTNLTKSSAFVERDDVIYYIRLGYLIDYQQPNIPIGLKKAAIAKENMEKTKHIQKVRICENTFSKALTSTLNSKKLPPDVVQFCEMHNCQLEKETKQWVWLSYYNCYTNNQRVTQKFRNVYDFSFIKNSKQVG